MAYLNTGSYEAQLQNFAGELQRVTEMKDAAFNVKDRANEIVKTIGEAKMFLSGKPVTNYLVKQGKGALKAAVDKAKLKSSNITSGYSTSSSFAFLSIYSSSSLSYNSFKASLSNPSYRLVCGISLYSINFFSFSSELSEPLNI